jgi:hypothetical protein
MMTMNMKKTAKGRREKTERRQKELKLQNFNYSKTCFYGSQLLVSSIFFCSYFLWSGDIFRRGQRELFICSGRNKSRKIFTRNSFLRDDLLLLRQSRIDFAPLPL